MNSEGASTELIPALKTNNATMPVLTNKLLVGQQTHSNRASHEPGSVSQFRLKLNLYLLSRLIMPRCLS